MDAFQNRILNKCEEIAKQFSLDLLFSNNPNIWDTTKGTLYFVDELRTYAYVEFEFHDHGASFSIVDPDDNVRSVHFDFIHFYDHGALYVFFNALCKMLHRCLSASERLTPQEAQVFMFVKEEGEASAEDVAFLCGNDVIAAASVLKSLKDKGKIRSSGSKDGVFEINLGNIKKKGVA